MLKHSLAAFCLAVALCAPALSSAAEDPQITLLQAELRVTREQLAAANQQVAATIAAAQTQIQALQKQLAEATPKPSVVPAAPPEKK